MNVVLVMDDGFDGESVCLIAAFQAIHWSISFVLVMVMVLMLMEVG